MRLLREVVGPFYFFLRPCGFLKGSSPSQFRYLGLGKMTTSWFMTCLVCLDIGTLPFSSLCNSMEGVCLIWGSRGEEGAVNQEVEVRQTFLLLNFFKPIVFLGKWCGQTKHSWLFYMILRQFFLYVNRGGP